MKFFTMLLGCLIVTGLQAQFVIVNSPSGISGPYSFSAAGFGTDLSTGTWTADAVFVDDGTADPTLGCEALINGAAISGKIALIDRGTCDFSVKCLNAENEGAIAVVVFNHTAGDGHFSMGGGSVGDQVMIPCVMLSYEDGQIIRAALNNGPVNLTIGLYSFPNNVGADRDGVLRAANGVMPAYQAEAAGLMVTPGVAVTNAGTNEATGVLLAGTISFAPIGGSGTQVYNEAGSVDNIEPDSTSLIQLPEYSPDKGVGVYTIQYEIESDSVDDVTLDNSPSASFYLSENVYVKGGWDFANNRPVATNSYRRADGTEIELMSAFHLPIGEGQMIDSVLFYVTTNAANFGVVGNNNIRAYVYAWDDANEDGDAETGELTTVAIALVEFPDPSLTADWIKVPMVKFPDLEGKYEIPADDMTFIVGIRYDGSEEVFIGVDEEYDQTAFVNYVALTDTDLPYFWVSAWVDDIPDVDNTFVFTDFWGSLSTALIINESESSSTVDELKAVSINLFPNPASSRLTAEVELDEMSAWLEYGIRDAAGRVLFTARKENVLKDKSEFDVSALPAGQYFLTLQTEKGSRIEAFSVQR